MSSWVLEDSGTRWSRWWGGRVDAIAKGGGDGAPQYKRSRRGSVLLSGWLTPLGIGLEGPEGGGNDIVSMYFDVIQWRRTCCCSDPSSRYPPSLPPFPPIIAFHSSLISSHSLLESRGPSVDEPLVFVASR